MRIGIIGAGDIGGNLARRLTLAGHVVQIANSRGPETLADLEAETGATAVTTDQAARGAEVVVVTVPQKAVPGLGKDVLAGAAEGVVVIDTCNYYPRERDGRIAEIEAGLPESAWVAAQIGHPVVKVFNGIHAEHLLTRARPAGDPDRIALPMAGDDPAAKAVVARLVDDVGFDAVDAGPVAESWRMQPMTPVYGADASAADVPGLLAQASPERPEAFRA